MGMDERPEQNSKSVLNSLDIIEYSIKAAQVIKLVLLLCLQEVSVWENPADDVPDFFDSPFHPRFQSLHPCWVAVDCVLVLQSGAHDDKQQTESEPDRPVIAVIV